MPTSPDRPTPGLAAGPGSPASPPKDNPIFAVAAQAAALRRRGVDVIALAAGEPETATAPAVVKAARAAAADPSLHHYAAAAGLPELRQAVADAATRSGSPTGIEQVQITLGAKHALFTALAVLTSPGDEVLVLTPGWPGHAEAVTAARAVPVPVPTSAADGHVVTPALLERYWTSRTRALVLANPNNATGALHERAALQAVVDWCADTGVHLLADEVYAQLVFDQPHVPATALSTTPGFPADVADTVSTIGAVSKAHAMTGWRVGWLITTPDRAAAARRHVAATVTHVPGINQAAALAALADPGTPRRARDIYRRRRDRLLAALNAVDGVDCAVPGGGMFAFPDVSGVLEPGQSATELAADLLHTAHVATVPGAAFGAPDHLRVCFAVDDDTLDTAIERLQRGLTRPTTAPAAPVAPAAPGAPFGAVTTAGAAS